MAADPFDLGTSYLEQGAATAANAVSPESRDRAAARIRADLATERNRYLTTFDDQNASMGRLAGGKGALDRGRAWNNYFQGVGKGLGELEARQADQSIQAAGVQNQSGQGIGTIGTQKATVKQNAANSFIQGGNVFADPTGQAAQKFWSGLGLDTSGLGFFGGPGTTNPISVPGGGTSIPTPGTGGSNPGTIGGIGLNPNSSVEEQGNAIITQKYKPGTPVVMASEFTQTPLGNYIYNKLIELSGSRVRLVPQAQWKSSELFSEDTSGYGPPSYGHA